MTELVLLNQINEGIRSLQIFTLGLGGVIVYLLLRIAQDLRALKPPFKEKL